MEKYGIKRIVTCEMLDRHPEARSYVVEEMTRELVDSIVPKLQEGEKIVKLSNAREFQEGKDFQCMTVRLERIVTIDSLIRCRDCKHWTQSMGKMKGYGLGKCDFHDAELVTCNGFCYWAERRSE